MRNVFDRFRSALSRGRGRSAVARAAVEGLEGRRLLAATVLTNGTGDGSLSVTVDAYGAFGSDATPGDDANYNPVGPNPAAGTTFESAVYFSPIDSYLAQGDIGGSGNLPDVAFTSTSTTQAVSRFTVGGFDTTLTQRVNPITNQSSTLTQTYQMTNTGTSTQQVRFVRHIDGDLGFVPGLDDFAGVSADGRFLFEFDTATNPDQATGFVGIRNDGGTHAGNTIQQYRYSDNIVDANGIPTADLNQIEQGTTGAGTDADANNDRLTDFGYDVTLSLQNNFTVAPGQTITFSTVTIFGQGAPRDVVNTQQLQFSAAAYTTPEAAGQAQITVTRLGGTAGSVAVDYATIAGGTATAGADYTTTTGRLTFAAGQSTATFNIPIANDNLDEPDETVLLRLTNPSTGAELGTPTDATLTITDDDVAGLPTLSINNVTVNEGNAGTVNATFTVTLSAASNQPVTVTATTANGTATSPADYAQGSQTLTIPAGQTTATFTVQVQGDTVDESNETFFVNLTAATNATIADNQGLGTIVDDDNPPTGDLQVTRFVLVDADNDQDLFDLTDGTVINLATLPTRNLNVRAETSSGVASVRFNLDRRGGKVESVLPFALFGDNGPNNNDYRAGRFRTGSHNLAATPYAGPQATGQAGETFDVDFQVIDQPVLEVTRLVLVNADTDQDIMELTNGTVVDLSTIGTQNLNVRAETSAGVESVRFGLDGNSRFKVESTKPFSLFGDDGPNDTDYRAGRFSVGSHTLSVTPYTRGQARGTAGTATTVTFQVQP